jgi:hypothetical protein
MSRHTLLRANINEDDMANNWGASYVEDVKTTSGTRIELDTLVRKHIPGYRLLDMVESGTSANDRVVSLATGGCYTKCLFGMGSYAGGVGMLHQYSTTELMQNMQLSLVKHPTDCNEQTREQTVAMPYMLHGDFSNEAELVKRESQCLDAILMKLTVASMNGSPYEVFLLEYFLSGTGGELSTRFLLKLATVLKRFNVAIIADEVMTGGRVGPDITITTTLPGEFTDCVEFITLGKCFGCGIVLEKQQVHLHRTGRGTTTQIEPNEAYAKFKAITDRLARGYIETKRQKVVAALKLNDVNNELWGRGLLMFSSKARTAVAGNLKCRLLPCLEIGNKTKLRGGFAMTEWTRTKVNEHLVSSFEWWLQASKSNNHLSPSTLKIAEYIVRHPLTSVIHPEDVEDYIKKDGATALELLAEHRDWKIRAFGPRGGRCSKSLLNVIRSTLRDGQRKSNGFLTPTLKTKKRRLCYEVCYDKLTSSSSNN